MWLREARETSHILLSIPLERGDAYGNPPFPPGVNIPWVIAGDPPPQPPPFGSDYHWDALTEWVMLRACSWMLREELAAYSPPPALGTDCYRASLESHLDAEFQGLLSTFWYMGSTLITKTWQGRHLCLARTPSGKTEQILGWGLQGRLSVPLFPPTGDARCKGILWPSPGLLPHVQWQQPLYVVVTVSLCPYKCPPPLDAFHQTASMDWSCVLCFGCLGKPPLPTWLSLHSFCKKGWKPTRTLQVWMSKEDQPSKKTISTRV